MNSLDRSGLHGLRGLLVVLAAAIAPGAARSAPTTESEFLGQQIIPTATVFPENSVIPFGGLSGMAYDERRNVFYAFSRPTGPTSASTHSGSASPRAFPRCRSLP